MGDLLRTSGRRLAYCHQCDRPAGVIDFEMEGWPHQFSLCGRCLMTLAKEAELSPRDLPARPEGGRIPATE